MGELLDAAKRLLKVNRRYGVKDGVRFQYTVPSPVRYPFQWFWDSCFHAIVLARFDVEAARAEIESLLAWQRPDGFVPHVILWRRPTLRQYWVWLQALGLRPRTTELGQPPVLAQAAERVYLAGVDDDWLARVLPAVERYYAWLSNERAGAGGLLRIVTPNESGMDHNPSYDSALGLPRDPAWIHVLLKLRLLDLRNRRAGYSRQRLYRRGSFLVVDLLDNAAYVQGLRSLARLQRASGQEIIANATADRAASVARSLIEHTAGGDGRWYNFDERHARPLRVNTISSLMVLLLEELPGADAERLVTEELGSPARFGAPFPVPSVALNEPSFRAEPAGPLIWRGSTWINTNWLLASALEARGFEDAAGRIKRSSLELVRRHGFREFFNPLTGEPGGASDFGWSTLAADFEA